jgi:photosystem II stability/assembly factor-like uncharacterized protein
MKKIVFTFLFIFFPLCTSYSQSGWFWQNPLPQGNILECVQYLQDGIVYAVGRVGTVLKSTNNGLNWMTLSYPSVGNLKCVFFLNANTGWIAGYTDGVSGNLYYTINGGALWINRTIKDSLTNIYTVRFADENTGYAGGSEILYKTTNSGINWFQCYNTNTYYSGIYFLTSDLAFVSVGSGFYDGKIIKTTNGGMSWQASSFSTPVDNIYFLNSLSGFAVSLQKILGTADMGGSWGVVYTAPQYTFLLSVTRSSNSNVFACGTYEEECGIIVRSTNEGLNWNLMQIGGRLRLNSISFADSQNGITVGTRGEIYKTSDGGSSWNEITYGNLNNLNSISFTNSTGCAVGDSGVVLRTTNAGSDWYLSNNPGPLKLYAVKLIDESTGYAAGKDNTNGIIYKTTNGGANWFISTQPASAPVSAMSWLNNNTGFAGCSNGVLLKTVNGGSNWISSASGLAKIYSLSFLDANTGYALLDTSSSLFKTTNGGVNWSQIASSISCLYFLNSSTGFTAHNNVIRKTTNGGTSWTSYNIIPSGEILAICFYNENTGYAGGSDGFCCKTTNGGQSWFQQSTPTRNKINSITVTSSNIAYISGENGMILKTTTGGEPMNIKPISSEIPNKFSLSQNYPNPFNPVTKIKYQIPLLRGVSEGRGVFVKLIIYDVLGREISVLINERLSPGTYEVEWDGSNYPSGVYFYELTTEEFAETKRMVLLK